MTEDRTTELAVLNLVSAMDKRQRLELLREVVDNMAERGDAEEMADFVLAQLGGDAVQVCSEWLGIKTTVEDWLNRRTK
jgi:hypothetical protein